MDIIASLKTIIAYIVFFLGFSSLFTAPFPCLAGTYVSSAHGDSSNGVSRAALGTATGKGYATGNCSHCHEQHASIGGSEPAPQGGAPDIYLGFESEESLCYGCHAGVANTAAPDSSGSPDDIKTVISSSFGHYPADYSAKHQADELQSNITNNLHVECSDCHNPHMAGDTTHSIGSNDITTTASPLYGATGTGTSSAELSATSAWGTPNSSVYHELATATKEYQICFKCHAGAVGTPNTWRGASGTTTWTDVAKEFNPSNLSFHPVVQTLSAGAGSSALDNSQLYATPTGSQQGWTNAGTKTMYCSDCHGDNTTPKGPHGSTLNIMLRNTTTYDLWPFNPSGDPWDLKDLANNSNNWSTRMLCRKCHPIMSDINDYKTTLNNPHTKHTDRAKNKNPAENYPCITCHIAVPHGGSLARLMGKYSEASPYTITLSGTFTIGRAGGSNSNVETNPKLPWLTAFTKKTRNGYSDNDCTVHTDYNNDNCGGHH